MDVLAVRGRASTERWCSQKHECALLGSVKPCFRDADEPLVTVYALTLKWRPLSPHPDSHMASSIPSRQWVEISMVWILD